MASIRKNKKFWIKYLNGVIFEPFPRKEVIQYAKYLGGTWIEEKDIRLGKFLTTSW